MYTAELNFHLELPVPLEGRGSGLSHEFSPLAFSRRGLSLTGTGNGDGGGHWWWELLWSRVIPSLPSEPCTVPSRTYELSPTLLYYVSMALVFSSYT